MKRIILLLILILFVTPVQRVFGVCAETSVTSSPDKRTEIAANMRQAKHLMEKGDYVAAKRKLERVLELDKDHLEAKTLLAECERKIEAQKAAELKELTNAVDEGTEQALRSFIERYPEGFYKEQAEKYLQDLPLWAFARHRGTKEAYLDYLSNSIIQGYKNEAEQAIRVIDAEAAWEVCKKNKTIEGLEAYIDEYSNTPFENEAKFELYLIKAEDFYTKGSRDMAMKYYEDAHKIHSLRGDYLMHYRELETEKRYNQLKTSNSVSDMKDFLSRTSTASPYYDPISNRLAIVLANNLTIRSTEQDFKEVLQYAKDESIRASVKQSIDNIKTRQRDQRSQKRRAERKDRWKGKTSWGWNICDLYFGKDVIELETGLRLKFGQSDQTFNFIVGSDIQLFMVSYDEEYDGYYSGYSYTLPATDFVVKWAIPAGVRLNIGKGYYLGLGMVLYPNIATTKSPCIAVEPQIGISGFLGDFAIHLRHMSNPYGISYNGEVSTMIGYQWTLYF